MFSSHESSDKFSHNCLKHGSSKVIYFCGESNCHESLCSACKSEHFNNHIKMSTDCMLLSFTMVLSETKDKVRNSIKRLNSFINTIKSEELSSSNTSALSPNSPNTPSMTEKQELEDLKKEYLDILKKLDGPDSLKVLKVAYIKDYETELEGLKRKFLQKCDIRENVAPKRPVQGLKSIIEELRGYGYKRGQPLQSGIEDEISIISPVKSPILENGAANKRSFIRPQQLNIGKISEDQNIPEAMKTFEGPSSFQSLTPIEKDTSIISKISLNSDMYKSPELGSAKLGVLKVPSFAMGKDRPRNARNPVTFTRALRGTDEGETFDRHDSEDNSHLSFDNTLGSWNVLSANSVTRDPNHDFLKTFRE